MPRKSKIDLKLKINLVKQVAHHQLSIPEAARKAHVDKTTFRRYLLAYSQEGIEGLYPTTRNRVYAPELKLKAVRDYLAGNGSQFSICEKYGIQLDELEQKTLKLLHSKTGAAVARDMFGVDDEIYSAIWYHTTGHADMSKLEKIIYLADYIEPSRDFPGVDGLRNVCYEDLDKGLLKGLEMTIEEMTAMGNPVHRATIEARDALKG